MNSRCPKLAHGNNKKQNTENQRKTESGNQSVRNCKKSNHFYAARENAEM